MVKVREAYTKSRPSVDFRWAVGTIVDALQPKYLIGLEEIVLRDASGFTRQEMKQTTRSRGRKVLINECRGLYYARTPRQGAMIVLFIDNIIGKLPLWVFRVPLFRDILLARTLFHEIGHHIHSHMHPEYKDSEAVANHWRQTIRREYFRKRYWYLAPLVLPIRLAVITFRFISNLIDFRRRKS